MNRHAHLHHVALAAIGMLSPMVWSATQSTSSPAAAPARDAATRLVVSIQRADYEGDRAALQRFYDELAPLVQAQASAAASAEDRVLAARVRYWRGFAMWRRAMNGFNDSTDPKELARDAEQAVREFEEVLRGEPGFVDAKVGAISCLQMLTFLSRDDATRAKELVSRFVPMLKESLASAPENPRLLWVAGAGEWYSPPGLTAAQVEERHARAMATYRRGLQLAREQHASNAQHPQQPQRAQQTEQAPRRDALDPAWGEPELLMSLAWASLNQTTPDVAAAERYANDALALVPHWHYLRDILMPQIRRAQQK